MRRILLARIRPLVDSFAKQLTEILVARADAEIERMEEALEVALSAYQSDAASDAPDILTAAFGPELAKMLTPPPAKPRTLLDDVRSEIARHKTNLVVPQVEKPKAAVVQRDIKPQNLASDSNARTCGCAPRGPHRRGCNGARAWASPTTPRGRHAAGPVPDDEPMTAIVVPERPLSSIAGEVAAAKARMARIASRARVAPAPRAATIGREPEDDNPNADDSWPAQRIAEEREHAERRKHDGKLPNPESSFQMSMPTRAGEFGDVEELDFGDAG